MADRRSRTPKLVEAVPQKQGRAGKAKRGSRRGGGSRLRRWAVRLVVLGLLAAVVGVGAAAGVFVYYGMDPDLPNLSSVADYRPKVVTRVVDRDGELLGEIFEERRTVVDRKKIADTMVHAIVDAEDAQFYEHKGLDYTGMLRAAINNLRPGAHLQGASTITQQLVKTYLLKTNERTLKRKVQEAILARRLEEKLGKDEILWLYLNQIYFGHQRYGVEEAARYYFGRSVADVDAGQAAVLASLPKMPEGVFAQATDPRTTERITAETQRRKEKLAAGKERDRYWACGDEAARKESERLEKDCAAVERLKGRQRYVLEQMVRYGHLARDAAERFAAAPIEVVKAPPSLGAAPEFVDEARRALVAKHGAEKLPYLGITVRTTCDARVQKLAREALESSLRNIDERQKYREPLAHLKTVTPDTIRSALRERALKRLNALIENPTKAQKDKWLEDRQKALREGKVAEAVVTSVTANDEEKRGPAGVIVSDGDDEAFVDMDAKESRYNPKGLPVEKRFKPGDVITVRVEDPNEKLDESNRFRGAVPEFGPQGAAVVIDVETREVRAMVGGYGFRAGGYNRATMAKRQPGSAFKPFLYATAFASKQYTPASVLDDKPEIYEQPGMADWRPKNAESHEFMGQVRLRTALARSLNTVASQLIEAVGPGAVARLAHDAGIASKLDENLALGLGSSVVTLTELTNAYATFAAQGKRADSATILKIGDEELARDPAEQAIEPEVAFLVTSVMRSVIDEGTGASAKGKLKGRPAAGKTGTTSSERDAWFVGYTPDVTVGVWVGFDDMRDLGRGEQGARAALPVWIDVINGAHKDRPPREFAQPPGIEVRRIDKRTGLLAPTGSPEAKDAKDSMDEFFLQGTAPTQEAPAAGEQNPDTYLIDQTP